MDINVEAACKRCQSFIKREERSLSVFTGDQRIIYIPDKDAEFFKLNIRENRVIIPMHCFLEKDFDENLIMWNIYMAMALYSDWTKNPEIYLKRNTYFQNEISNMLLYIREKVEKEGLTEDPAYSEKILKHYVTGELRAFLNEMDRYYSYLRVQLLCPLYRQKENLEIIVKNLENEGYRNSRLRELSDEEVFSRLFMLNEMGENYDFDEYSLPRKESIKSSFGTELWKFYRLKLKEIIMDNKGVRERDSLTALLVLPSFIKLWKKSIDEMSLLASTGSKNENISSPFNREDAENENSFDIDDEEKDRIYKELDEEKKKIRASAEDVIKGKLDLRKYGVQEEDRKLYEIYVREMDKERNEMKKLWKKLIGDARKEVNVKNRNQPKGKLNVSTLIDSYPDFVESERRGSYKDIYIFDRYFLQPYKGMLPDNIDVSFVLDNSGSMTAEKLDYERRALTVALLSLEDFSEYLKANAEHLHQKININVETWHFGSNYRKVLSAEDKREAYKKKANMMLSVVKLKGNDGSTDDGSCLKEIRDSITPLMKREIEKRKRIKIIFEITDGASSFPSMAKEAVTDLINTGVEIYAIEIGDRDEMTEKVFNYIWQEGYNESHGVFLGDNVEKLPKELMKAVANNMKSVFNCKMH